MSEENNDNQTQPLDTEPLQKQQMRKTSAVPLRKETVRVTLKSTPAGAKRPTPETSPVEPKPKAPMPTTMTQGTAPHVTSAPKAANPDLPDVTSAVPLKQETMRVTLKADKSPSPKAPAPAEPTTPPPAAPVPAATIPLGGAPKIAAPAPTIPLNVGAAAGGPATIPLATQALPKATVQLQQTQPLGEPAANLANQAPTIHTVVDEESSVDRTSNTGMIFAVAAFVLSLFLLFAQFQRAGIWVNEHEDGSYGAIFSANN